MQIYLPVAQTKIFCYWLFFISPSYNLSSNSVVRTFKNMYQNCQDVAIFRTTCLVWSTPSSSLAWIIETVSWFYPYSSSLYSQHRSQINPFKTQLRSCPSCSQNFPTVFHLTQNKSQVLRPNKPYIRVFNLGTTDIVGWVILCCGTVLCIKGCLQRPWLLPIEWH